MTQEQALDILKTGANVFLTGEPGSGKTYTVNRYVSYLREHNIEAAITASTGIVATHIGGMTIHSWSGIGIKKELTPKDLSHICDNDRIAKRIKRTKVLLIDEISMLDANTLSLIDLVCREVKEVKVPFGGMQIIFVGDFFQLPPVARDGKVAQFAFESGAWEFINPVTCYLSEQHRQEDNDFLDILLAIRSASFDEKHYYLIEKRMNIQENIPDHITKLFSHNADVDRVNNKKLEQISGKNYLFEMKSSGRKSLVESMKSGCISPEELFLKIGAAVMFTKNSPSGRFVNETLGEVIGFDKESGYPIVKTKGGKNIKVEPMDWIVEENGYALATISQVPLRLAWAITIHKSQGMSLDAAVMDLNSVFEYGQGYVALSRVRTLSGLYLLGLNETALLVHPEVLKKDGDFRGRSEIAQKYLLAIPEDELKKKMEKFIISCGGSLSPSTSIGVKKEKPNTYDETLVFFKAGKSILEIAKLRGYTEGTIINHIEKLHGLGKLKDEEVKPILNDDLVAALPKIHAAFSELDELKLSPVFEKFKGKYSYYDLRLARMVLKSE